MPLSHMISVGFIFTLKFNTEVALVFFENLQPLTIETKSKRIFFGLYPKEEEKKNCKCE